MPCFAASDREIAFVAAKLVLVDPGDEIPLATSSLLSCSVLNKRDMVFIPDLISELFATAVVLSAIGNVKKPVGGLTLAILSSNSSNLHGS